MKTPLVTAVVAAVLLVAAAAPAPHDAFSRPRKEDIRGIRPAVQVPDGLAAEGRAALAETGRTVPTASAAAVDTYCVVWYDFEPMNMQGWTFRDETAQEDTFFHVDDFDGLGGGDFGRLVPIEGSKSAWCGTRGGDDFYLCSWYFPPGYGNNWDQALETDQFYFTPPLTLSYHGVFDGEIKWDYTAIEYLDGDEWVTVHSIDGTVDTIAVHTMAPPLGWTRLRFHFVSDGAWSDQDGLYNTDGGCIIDSITVSDSGGLIDFEDFESAQAGDLDTDFWHCRPGNEGFGQYAALFANLLDKDPCGDNFGTQIIFFNGSVFPGPDYDWMPATPFCKGAGGIEAPCQYESANSPVIDLTRYSSGCNEYQDQDIPAGELPTLGGVIYRFTVYRDLPLQNLVFYNWAVIDIIDGCPREWQKRTAVYYGAEREYIEVTHYISDLITADHIQVRLVVFDWCALWYGVYGDCAEHTPAPYFDNVRIYRYSTAGPQWSVRDLDLFQDTFPQDDGDMESFCRADMANDISPQSEFTRIDPGDSAVVGVGGDIGGELDTLPTGEAMVYFHCDVRFLGHDGKPDLSGAQLEGTYGTWLSTDAGGWDIFICEPARTSAGNIAPDKYCVDLNDSLFTRGYMVEYYFKAYGSDGVATTYPRNAEASGGDRYEFTCLPALNAVPGLLYCDDFHGRGTFDGLVQTYMDPALEANTKPGPFPDRYDVNQPGSGVSNGLGAYVSAAVPPAIFSYAYSTVIYDSGDLDQITISEGTDWSDKSNDARLLVDWLRYTPHNVNLLVMGDQVASDLNGSSSAVALELMSTVCGVSLAAGSYYELTGGDDGGGVPNPLITGVAGGPFDGMTYYAAGGCPTIEDFDVIETTGAGQYALQYPDYSSSQYFAGIYTDQFNDMGQPMRTLWTGHSFMHIRNVAEGPLARNRIINLALQFFEEPSSIGWTDAEIPKATSLSQNFPNPFNPATRVKFALKEKGLVRLRVYDVTGRLVRVLVDGILEAGAYEAVWDGNNAEGRATTSGIYFCRMEAKDYERTLKMVLLR